MVILALIFVAALVISCAKSWGEKERPSVLPLWTMIPKPTPPAVVDPPAEPDEVAIARAARAAWVQKARAAHAEAANEDPQYRISFDRQKAIFWVQRKVMVLPDQYVPGKKTLEHNLPWSWLYVADVYETMSTDPEERWERIGPFGDKLETDYRGKSELRRVVLGFALYGEAAAWLDAFINPVGEEVYFNKDGTRAEKPEGVS